MKEDNNLFDNINEAIEKLKLKTLADRFEVVLNNNLIETKEKLTNYRTIFGCRITYDNLDKNISFIVREDTKPTYEKLEQRINKAIEYIENNQWELEENGYEDDLKIESKPILKILKGEDKQ